MSQREEDSNCCLIIYALSIYRHFSRARAYRKCFYSLGGFVVGGWFTQHNICFFSASTKDYGARTLFLGYDAQAMQYSRLGRHLLPHFDF